jgi:hypothetical protein
MPLLLLLAIMHRVRALDSKLQEQVPLQERASGVGSSARIVCANDHRVVPSARAVRRGAWRLC